MQEEEEEEEAYNAGQGKEGIRVVRLEEGEVVSDEEKEERIEIIY